jgi:hypothetical protein
MPTRIAAAVLLCLVSLALPGCAGRSAPAERAEMLSEAEAKQAAALARSRSAALEQATGAAPAWTLIETYTFDAPDQIRTWLPLEGEWRIEDGILKAVAGAKNRVILLPMPNAQAVKLQFEAMLLPNEEGLVCDITTLVNSVPDERFFRHGYALTTASYWNQESAFYRRGERLARSEGPTVRPGEPVEITVEVDSGHLRYLVDGEVVLETWDARPLALERGGWLGLRSWETPLWIDNLRIYRGE